LQISNTNVGAANSALTDQNTADVKTDQTNTDVKEASPSLAPSANTNGNEPTSEGDFNRLINNSSFASSSRSGNPPDINLNGNDLAYFADQYVNWGTLTGNDSYYATNSDSSRNKVDVDGNGNTVIGQGGTNPSLTGNDIELKGNSNTYNGTGSIGGSDVDIYGTRNKAWGSAGEDLFHIYEGEKNTIRTGAGEDELFMNKDTVGNWAFGGDQDDRLVSNGIGNELHGEDGNDVLEAGAFSKDNILYGGNGDDDISIRGNHTVYGGNDNDTITSIFSNNSFIDGGAGDRDTLSIDMNATNAKFTADAENPGTYILSGENRQWTIQGIEEVIFEDGTKATQNSQGTWEFELPVGMNGGDNN